MVVVVVGVVVVVVAVAVADGRVVVDLWLVLCCFFTWRGSKSGSTLIQKT